MTTVAELEAREKETMTKIVSHESNMEHYTADAWCVECIDDRFRDVLDEVKRTEKWGNFDRTQWAGGAQEIALEDPKSLTPVAEAILGQLAKSIKLHHTKSVVLTVHEACGAYGDVMPRDVDGGNKFMQEELRKAAETVRVFLQNAGLDLPIRKCIVRSDGIYEVS